MITNKPNAIPELVLIASISGGVAIVLSLISIVYSTLALIFRYECSFGEVIEDGAQLFWKMLLRVYILEEKCTYYTKIFNLTSSESIFILVILTLCFAAVNFFAAITLVAAVKRQNNRNIDVVAYFFIGTSVALLVVDLALGAHFGMDYQYVKDKLSETIPGFNNYLQDLLRMGSFLLMSIALKGYIGHAINIVLLVVLVVYLVNNQRRSKENEHSIHKMGALNGFEAPRPMREEHPWQQQRNDIFLGYPRSNTNPVFNNDDVLPPPPPPQRPIRENPLADYSNSPYRAEPWSVAPMNSNPNPPMGTRPFSYLEEPKRPLPVKPPMTPAKDPHWRRDPWPQAPPVPDPDYSPPARRLKSALKTY